MEPIHAKHRMLEIAARLGELYAEQEGCQAQIAAQRARLSRTRAAIARLEAERRALEWGLRADLARLLEDADDPGQPHRRRKVHLRPAGIALSLADGPVERGEK